MATELATDLATKCKRHLYNETIDAFIFGGETGISIEALQPEDDTIYLKIGFKTE